MYPYRSITGTEGLTEVGLLLDHGIHRAYYVNLSYLLSRRRDRSVLKDQDDSRSMSLDAILLQSCSDMRGLVPLSRSGFLRSLPQRGMSLTWRHRSCRFLDLVRS